MPFAPPVDGGVTLKYCLSRVTHSEPGAAACHSVEHDDVDAGTRGAQESFIIIDTVLIF